jgi:hypothetical protein
MEWREHALYRRSIALRARCDRCAAYLCEVRPVVIVLYALRAVAAVGVAALLAVATRLECAERIREALPVRPQPAALVHRAILVAVCCVVVLSGASPLCAARATAHRGAVVPVQRRRRRRVGRWRLRLPTPAAVFIAGLARTKRESRGCRNKHSH